MVLYVCVRDVCGFSFSAPYPSLLRFYMKSKSKMIDRSYKNARTESLQSTIIFVRMILFISYFLINMTINSERGL